MGRRSITKRWLINSVGVIFLLLVVVDIAAAYFIQNYYYNSVKQYLNSRMNVISSVMLRHSQDAGTNFAAEVRNMVEGFEEKESMELMAVNKSGRVVLTSSGFSASGEMDMPDYRQAVEAESGSRTGYQVGKLANGEKIMAISVLVPENQSGYSAMRLVVSLVEVDRQIKALVIAITIGCACVLGLMIFSGFYFIKSIVMPVRQIGVTARRLAVGDFSVRIDKRSDDEIGELSDIINYMADELSNSEQVKNDFISSVSHELRTPLTAIKGWAETLDDIDDQETIKKGMRVISSESERLSSMVEELLDFSRIQNGRFNMLKANMDILAELGEAVLIYQEKARREGIEIIYNEPELLPFIHGDKNRLRQVFINIIDNAIKYSDAGGCVTIEAAEKGAYIEIIVSDTGCGISATDLPRIKTKFFKANHNRRGSGIGLAVAEEIISMHDGILSIDSVEGVGTTVTIEIPINLKRGETKPLEIAIPDSKERTDTNE